VNSYQVFKFGGASVKDAEGIKNVANIVGNFSSEKLLIVVSAMGKTTNALEVLLEKSRNDEDYSAALNELRDFHTTIIDDLGGDSVVDLKNEINKQLSYLEKLLPITKKHSYDYSYDLIVSQGEILSTKIVSGYLNTKGFNNQWLDVREYIKTNNTHRDSKVLWDETITKVRLELKGVLDKNPVVTQGFIGSSRNGNTTTLGREGSDFSAAILAYCLECDKLTIWKDVEGILSADPKKFDNPTKIEKLSFHEALEMTYFGAKVLHPKTIKPLQNKDIALEVKSFKNYNKTGTLINSIASDNELPPIIVRKENQVLVSFTTTDFSFIAEDHLSEIFTCLAKHRVKINLMQNSARSFSICTGSTGNRAQKVIDDLQEHFDILTNEDLQLLTIRHYTDEKVEELVKGKEVLLEQKTRNTVQLILK